MNALSLRTVYSWRYALALAVVGVAGYAYFGTGAPAGATLTIVPGDFLQQVRVSGTVIPARDANLGFAANGRVSGVYAQVGQHVSAGTILAETENGDLRAALAEDEADLAALTAGARPEERAVADAAVANAKANLATAVQNAYTVADDAIHNRADALFTNPRIDPKLSFSVSNAVLVNTITNDRIALEPVFVKWAALIAALSEADIADAALHTQKYLAQVTALLADLNTAVNQGMANQTTTAATLSTYNTSVATARTNVNAAATTLASYVAALSTAEKNLALTRADATSESIAAARATVAAAQAALAKTRVVAPFSGIVTRLDAKVGEIISPTTPVISLQGNGIFHIETYVPEVAIAGVAVGNSATTTLDAYGLSVAFPAVVVRVDPAETVKDGVPTYKVTLAFRTADPRIRSGMTANVTLVTGTLPNAIVIPEGAVSEENGSSYVSLIKEGEIVKRSVTAGLSPALGQVAILSGLSGGDVVLLEPAR